MTNPSEFKRNFAAELGEFMIAWNQAENTLRYLLLTMWSNERSAHVMIAELGAVGLDQAIRAISEKYNDDVKEAVRYILTVYERLRAFRNYYAHGVTGFVFTEGRLNGYVYAISGKEQLVVAKDFISIDDLARLKRDTVSMSQDAERVIDTINPQPGSQAQPPLPSRGKSPLPDALAKSRTILPLGQRPPPASGE